MTILVCGGRDFVDRQRIFDTLDSLAEQHEIDLVVHGAARGADAIAGMWADERGVDVHSYPADWRKLGKSAGHVRNKQMLDSEEVDLVVPFPGGTGTRNMVDLAISRGIKVMWTHR